MIEKVKMNKKEYKSNKKHCFNHTTEYKSIQKWKKDHVSAKNSIWFFLLCTVTLELPMQHDPLYVWKLDAPFYASS